MNTVEKYSARLQAMKEEMDGITPEIKATRHSSASKHLRRERNGTGTFPKRQKRTSRRTIFPKGVFMALFTVKRSRMP